MMLISAGDLGANKLFLQWLFCKKMENCLHG